jgi:hypothetical protein
MDDDNLQNPYFAMVIGLEANAVVVRELTTGTIVRWHPQNFQRYFIPVK